MGANRTNRFIHYFLTTVSSINAVCVFIPEAVIKNPSNELYWSIFNDGFEYKRGLCIYT